MYSKIDPQTFLKFNIIDPHTHLKKKCSIRKRKHFLLDAYSGTIFLKNQRLKPSYTISPHTT